MSHLKVSLLVVAFIVSSVGMALFLADRKGTVPISAWVAGGFQDQGSIQRLEAYHKLRSVYSQALTVWREGCAIRNEVVVSLRVAADNAKNLIEWQAVYSNSEFVDRAMDSIRKLLEVTYTIDYACR